jgi:hypothetical protein
MQQFFGGKDPIKAKPPAQEEASQSDVVCEEEVLEYYRDA